MAERLYPFVAVVRRIVMDNMRFTVRADTVEEARSKAKSFLQDFPDASEVDGIDYAYIDNRENLDVEVLDCDIDKGN